ncbi:MAG: Crp/Fnr family transcriptional regulator [Gammaproteobacteria bacterium]|nr:MAG: Crp/Fnr family transcriptional regulator [Gammaproteobacteria bacterium]
MNKKNAVEQFQKNILGQVDAELTSSLVTVTSIINIDKKQELFAEGEPGKFVYFLLDGSIRLFRTNLEGKECVIRFVAPGEIFAEILFSERVNYPVNSMAVQNSTLLAISASGFFKLVEHNPSFTMKYIASITKRLKYFVDLVENLTTADVQSRFMSYLNHAVEESGGNTITLPVPKGDLSLLLGTTPESFSRTLKKLSQDGIIDVNGKNITLL